MKIWFNSEGEDLESALDLPADAVADILIALAAQQHGAELTKLVARVRTLQEQVAGLRRGPTSDDGRRRLQHPALKTTYPELAVRALQAAAMKGREELEHLLINAIRVSLKLKTNEEELAEHRALQEQALLKHSTKADVGLYPAAAAAVNRLYSDHGITHHHWAAVSPERLRRIAGILVELDGQ
ncbi:hypothetical protein V6R86_08425 [Sphingomonas kaistensis]|uniref:Uncharacterized protein n=1 Tax=Sphingomonas kaistensis TaxID=298708 RepID=A0ABZ2G4I8_9SPHN